MSDPTQRSIAALMLKLRQDLIEADEIIQTSCNDEEASTYSAGIREILEQVERVERFLEALGE